MSIKRLKHHAQNLGQMFCGWELMFDYKRLAELENGNLFLNVLTGECFHNGNKIEPLKIVTGLRKWLVADLEANKLNINQIECAELSVQFSTIRLKGQKIKKQSWADPTPYFVYCTLQCNSRIKTQDREFSSSYHDEEEWPESYSWIN
jgi:hypothetical protein